MQLFQLREPTGACEEPGIPVEIDPIPHIFLGTTATGLPYRLPLSKQLAQGAKAARRIDPRLRLLAADIIPKREGNAPLLVPEWGWDRAKARRAALLHLDTSAGVGGRLILSGPHGAPTVLEEDTRKVVRRPWLPFKDAAGVFILSDDVAEIEDDGVVRWKEGDSAVEMQPFLLVALLKGASFRVVRTGDLDGAPSEFTVHWDGHHLRTRSLPG